MVFFAIVLSGYILWGRGAVGQKNPMQGTTYAEIEARLQADGAQGTEVVIINDPPGYFLQTKRPSIVIPVGGIEAVVAVAERYEGKYLVLEIAQPGLEDLFNQPNDRPGLDYLGMVGSTHIYRIEAGGRK
jgi:hypothetical protein